MAGVDVNECLVQIPHHVNIWFAASRDVLQSITYYDHSRTYGSGNWPKLKIIKQYFLAGVSVHTEEQEGVGEVGQTSFTAVHSLWASLHLMSICELRPGMTDKG